MLIIKTEAKAARFVGCVIFTFVLCWLPLAILRIVGASGTVISFSVQSSMFILAFCNSVSNPLIYFGHKNRMG